MAENITNIRPAIYPSQKMPQAESQIKSFLENDRTRGDILSRSSFKELGALLVGLREHYLSAGDKASRNNSENAIYQVSIGMIKKMPLVDLNPTNNNVLNVLRFMALHTLSSEDLRGAGVRDAAEWTGKRVLAEGNINGCVEATKLFMILMKGTAQSADIKYLSSYSEKGAKLIIEELKKPEALRNKELIKNPPGHAMVEVTEYQTGRKIIVDASMFDRSILGRNIRDNLITAGTVVGKRTVQGQVEQFEGKNDVLINKQNGDYELVLYDYGDLLGTEKGRYRFSSRAEANQFLNNIDPKTVDLNELGSNDVIKKEVNGRFYKDAGEYSGDYRIFEKYSEPPYHSQYGPNGSSTKTLQAIIKDLAAELGRKN
ncbi:MAG: hypothetical protein WC838_06085 [Candidatus Margulisiibacteriota bacterium]|jgi:hypothetical protein